MQKEILVSENPIVRETSEGVVLKVLANLKNSRIEDALAGFAEEFRFKDHGIGLEFKDKQRLAEFFYKTRELYPDSVSTLPAYSANCPALALLNIAAIFRVMSCPSRRRPPFTNTRSSCE